MAIFAGPQTYISPSFYATKTETGKVVPTWNYEVLNVYGRLVAHDDPEWVLDLVTMLTNHHESSRAKPWQVTDAPETFTRSQLKAIVGVELVISRVEGKAKMSQNQPERNRTGVVAGLKESSEPADQRRRRPRRPPRKHERERPGVAQATQPGAADSVHINRPHLARRWFVTLPLVSGRVHDQHPMPGYEASDEHGDGPTGFDGGRHVRQLVAPAAKQPPAISDAPRGAVRVQRANHAARRRAQPPRPDPVHLGVHTSLLVNGVRIRFQQRCPVVRVEQRTGHHRDGRTTRHAVALPKAKGREFHASTR